MTQFTKGIYRITQVPIFYTFIQNALGGPAVVEQVVREIIQPAGGEDVLDLGCGAGMIMPLLDAHRYIGIDLNQAHIEAARNKYPGADFRVADAVKFLETTDADFDLIIMMGFLHHLNDEQVLRLMTAARRAMRKNGRMISLDPGFEAGQHPIAWVMSKMDSGRNVRTLEGYLALERRVFKDASGYVRRDLLRVPYTHVITVCRQT